MRKSAETSNIMLPALLLAFAVGVVNLFILRFDAGDTYPVYSSLRADPLGTKIFYESLGNLDGIAARRNYQPLSKIERGARTTLFCFGASSGFLFTDEDRVKALEALSAAGGRVVVLFHPGTWSRSPRNANTGTARGEQAEEKAQGKDAKKTVTDDEHSDDYDSGMQHGWISLEERWKFHTVRDVMPFKSENDKKPTALLVADTAALPDSVSWHSAVYFENPGNEWKTVYARDGHPVVIERSFGKGTIVLSADSFLVSNEAMSTERHPELLAWLVGANDAVIFDETHLGIGENPGIAALGRKYRLHSLFAGIMLLAFLFIWKNSFSLVPPYAEDDEGGEGHISTGKDYLSGFAALLRRSIPARDVLAVCFEEWKKTARGRPEDRGEGLQQMQAIVEEEKGRPAGARNPVGAYKTISTLLSERKRMP